MDWHIIGFGVSGVSMLGRYRVPSLTKPVASAGMAIGVGLIIVGAFSSIRLGPAVVGIVGLALLVGAIDWQVEGWVAKPAHKAVSPLGSADGQGSSASHSMPVTPPPNAKAPIRRDSRMPVSDRTSTNAPSPVAPETPTVTVATVDFWPIVGCAFPQGVPVGPTALQGVSNRVLQERILAYAKRLRAHELALRTALINAAVGDTDDLAKRQEMFDAVRHESIIEFQEKLKPEGDILVKELHVRLQRVYPTSTADGLTVGAFGAICGGLYFGETPLSDLADYLIRLGGQLQD